MSDLKKQIEAILFAAGRAVDLEELAKLCKVDSPGMIKEVIKELKQQYEEQDSPIILIPEGNGWKLTVREGYLPLVQQINPHTELSKAVLETLAVIAWKQPILQAEVIKVRTSQAYAHIKELVELGFVSKEKHGRSYTLKVTGKFFDYFDLPSIKAMQEVFKGFKEVGEVPEQLGKLQVYDVPEKKPEEKKPEVEVYVAKPAEEAKPEEKEEEAVEAEEEKEEKPVEEEVPLPPEEEAPKEKPEEEKKEEELIAEEKIPLPSEEKALEEEEKLPEEVSAEEIEELAKEEVKEEVPEEKPPKKKVKEPTFPPGPAEHKLVPELEKFIGVEKAEWGKAEAEKGKEEAPPEEEKKEEEPKEEPEEKVEEKEEGKEKGKGKKKKGIEKMLEEEK